MDMKSIANFARYPELRFLDRWYHMDDEAVRIRQTSAARFIAFGAATDAWRTRGRSPAERSPLDEGSGGRSSR
jgi:hypothetical protein